MTCSHCGKPIAQDTRFCPQCGAGVGRTGAMLDIAVHSIGVAMGLFFLYFLFRQALRKPWLSATAYALFFATLAGISYNALLVPILVNAITALTTILVLTRFGLLPLIIGILVSTILPGFPMTLDFSAWYPGATMMAIAAVLALAGFAFHIARTGRTA